MELMEKIGNLKVRHSLAIQDSRRENKIIENCRAKLKEAGFGGKITNRVLRDLTSLIASSRKFQQKGKKK